MTGCVKERIRERKGRPPRWPRGKEASIALSVNEEAREEGARDDFRWKSVAIRVKGEVRWGERMKKEKGHKRHYSQSQMKL